MIRDPEALQRFIKYESAQAEWGRTASELWEFVHNEQFTPDELDYLREHGFAAVPINVLFPAIEQAVTLLTSNAPSYQVTAREDSDRIVSKVLTDLMTYVWQVNNGNMLLKQSVRDYVIMGRGVLAIYFDQSADWGRGELSIQSLDPLEVFPDPLCRDRLWRDARELFVRRIMTQESILFNWPDAEPLLAEIGTASGDAALVRHKSRGEDGQIFDTHGMDPYATKYRVLEHYQKVRLILGHIRHGDSGREDWMFLEEENEFYAQPAYIHMRGDGQIAAITTDPIRRRQVEQLFEQGKPFPMEDDPDGEITRLVELPPQEPGMEPMQMILRLTDYRHAEQMGALTVRRVPQTRVRMRIMIEDVVFWEGILPVSEYPIIPIMSLFSRTPYPMSDVQFVKPIQRMLNKTFMLILANLQSSNSQKVLLPTGSINRDEWEMELAKPGVAVLTYNGEVGQPTIVGPQPLPSSLFNSVDMMMGIIERKLGIFSLQQGDPTAAPETFRGTLALDEFAQRRIRNKLDDIEHALVHMGRVALEMIQAYYTEEKTFRIVQPNGIERTVTINAPWDDLSEGVMRVRDISAGSYDVAVVAGSTLPSNRWMLQDYYMQMYERGIIDDVEVLKKSEVVDAVGVMERKSMIAQLQQQLQAAMEEIKRLKGDLQTAEREAVNARKRVEVEKFKADLTESALEAKKAAQLYAARTQDMQRMQDLPEKPPQQNNKGE